jgi:tRNA (mo5U34)-methyltransferase
MPDFSQTETMADVEPIRAPVIETLSSAQLEEINALLPWKAFMLDSNGRQFGRPASEAKRNRAAAIPDRKIVELDRRIPLRDLTVLEVGCFEGLHTVALAKRAREVKACDGRVVNIAKTAVRCAMFQVAPALFVWDVEKDVPPGQNIECDVLHHVGVLYHLFDPVAHLRSILRHVRRGILLDTHHSSEEMATDTYVSGGKTFRFRAHSEGGYHEPFEGMSSSSRRLVLPEITSLLTDLGFPKIEIINNRKESNGPRVTLIAERS